MIGVAVIQDLLSNSTLLKFRIPVRIMNFTPMEKAEAWSFAEQSYEQCFENGSLTTNELADFLCEMEIWTEKDENNYVEGMEDIQTMKVDYYDNYVIPTRRDLIKTAIVKKMAILSEAYSNKSYLYEYTCEAARDEAYGIYLFHKYDSPIFFYRKFITSRLTEEDIRDLCFNHTWRMIWSVCKEPSAIFGLNLNQLNDNQLSLLYWSKLYDNIGESTEAPASVVMKDQLAVDGWLIKQSKKRESEDRQNAITTKGGEVFLPASSKKEAKEIMALNTPDAVRIIKSRAKDLAGGNSLDERQFSHIKQDVGMKINELSMGGNK